MKKVMHTVLKIAVSRRTTFVLLAIPTITLVLSSPAFADAYQGKEDVHPDGTKTFVYNHTKPGALLPIKTWNDWDGVDRPCCWDGYGLDPGTVNKYGKVNWYVYFNEETECYPGYKEVWEGTTHCADKAAEEGGGEIGNIPEPSKPLLLGIGLMFLAWSRLFRNP